MPDEITKPFYVDFAKFKSLEMLKKNSVDLYLRYCGIEQCEPKHSFGQPRPDFWLHVVLSGKGFLRAENHTWHMTARHTFIIYPNQPVYYEADEQDPWSYAWIAFNGTKAVSAMEYAGFRPDAPTNILDDAEPFREAVQQMLEARHLTLSNEFLRESFLFFYVGKIMEKLHDPKQHHGLHDYSYQTYVDHAIDYIESVYSQNIKISKIAEHIGVSRSYLTRCFKTILNVSPQAYLLNFRLDKASALLKETTLPVKNIAAMVGYTDPMAFSKLFKRFFGQSPRQYRDAEAEISVVREPGQTI